MKISAAWCVVLLLSVCEGVAWGQAGREPQTIKSMMNVTVLEVEGQGENVVVTYPLQVFEPVQEAVKRRVIDQNGVEREVTEVRTRMVLVEKAVKRSLKEVMLYNGEGKELTGEARLAALGKGKALLVCQATAPDEKVDPSWFKLLRSEAVIMMIKFPTAATMPAPR